MSKLNLRRLWSHIGVILGLLRVYEGGFGSLLGYFGITLAPFWGYFGATLGIQTSNGRYDVCSCGFDGVIVRPKRAHKQEIHIFASVF